MTTTIRQTRVFSAWLADLRDVQAKARINARIRRLSLGNPGHHRVLQSGVAELKIDYGPGYRVYYTQRGEELVILLCGGDKRTQTQDIERAISMAGEV
jgi:putative addiction module killer protein